jgi:hypothetical protein
MPRHSNKFASLSEDSSPRAVAPLRITAPKPRPLPTLVYPVSDSDGAAAVAIVQRGPAAITAAMEDDTVSWGDLGWAEDWVAATRARAERRARGLPVTPPAPAPVFEPAAEEKFRVWDDKDDDASSVSTYDSAWSPRLCHGDPEYAEHLLERARAKAHRDPVTGEIEECRFFNSAAGCRSGDQCPYKHVQREQQTIECRFFKSPRGCRNGAKCPFKH